MQPATLEKLKQPRIWLQLAAFLLLAAWLVWLWYGKRDALPTKSYQSAPPAPAVAGVPTVPHPAPSMIKVVPKAIANKKLDLPTEVAGNDAKQVISTADISPAPDGATTVTVMDTTTGESTTLVKANPKPLFAFLRTGAVGVRYGIASSGDQQAALFVRQDVARVANIHLSATAEARTVPTKGSSEAFVAVEVSYRWY